MMDIFLDFSGLRLNRAKSSFIGFGLSAEEMAGCSLILSTPIRDLPIRYLGVPLADRRLRIRDWQPVLDKVETHLGGWRARLLSRGRRLIMLKAVLSAIPTYFMSIFRMPVGVQRRLEAVMRGFFLARIPSGGGKRDGNGDMGDRLSSGLPRRPGSTIFATYQLGVIDQVGEPPAPVVRGSIVGATSGLLRSLA